LSHENQARHCLVSPEPHERPCPLRLSMGSHAPRVKLNACSFRQSYTNKVCGDNAEIGSCFKLLANIKKDEITRP
jgi:hypothetical protein